MSIPAVNEAQTYDLAVQQGGTLALTLFIEDSAGAVVSLTSVTAASAKIRASFLSTATTLATISAVVSNGTAGELTLRLDSTTTAALTVPATTPDDVRVAQIGFWDLELTDTGGDVYRYVEGAVFLSREATT